MSGGTLDVEVTIVISAMVFGLTQLAKWQGLPDSKAPLAVILMSIASTFLWAWSGNALVQENMFKLVAGAVQIALGAAGIFGFSRSSASAAMRALPTKQPTNIDAANDAGTAVRDSLNREGRT